MESLVLAASLVFLSFLVVGPVALGISFSRAPWWFSAALGVLAMSMGLYAFAAFGNTSSFVWLGFLDFGCGLVAVFRSLTNYLQVPHE